MPLIGENRQSFFSASYSENECQSRYVIIHPTNPLKKYTAPALTLPVSNFPATSLISTTLEIESLSKDEAKETNSSMSGRRVKWFAKGEAYWLFRSGGGWLPIQMPKQLPQIFQSHQFRVTVGKWRSQVVVVKDENAGKFLDRLFEIGHGARKSGVQFIGWHIMSALADAHGNAFFRTSGIRDADETQNHGVTPLCRIFQKRQLVAHGIGKHRLENEALSLINKFLPQFCGDFGCLISI
jgi:hypothetical protein